MLNDVVAHSIFYVCPVVCNTKCTQHTHTHTHAVHVICSKFIVVKLPHHPKRNLCWPNNRNTLLCFSPAVPVYLLLIYSKEKHGHCLSIGSLSRSLPRSFYVNERPIEPTFSCLIICYYIVISISLFQVQCTFFSLRLVLLLTLTTFQNIVESIDSRDELVRNECVCMWENKKERCHMNRSQ